jgi:hypothetical protein
MPKFNFPRFKVPEIQICRFQKRQNSKFLTSRMLNAKFPIFLVALYSSNFEISQLNIKFLNRRQMSQYLVSDSYACRWPLPGALLKCFWLAEKSLLFSVCRGALCSMSYCSDMPIIQSASRQMSQFSFALL